MKWSTKHFVLEALKPKSLKDPFSLSFQTHLDDLEWNEALRFAEILHSKIPFLYFLKRSSFFSTIPTWLQDQTETSESRMRMSLALFDEELNLVAKQLGEKNIPCMVLKGLELGVRCYPSRLLRPMNDVDLLIPVKHYEMAVQMLRRTGYHITGNHYPGRFRVELSRSPETPIVELHFQLTETDNAKRIRGIWERSLDFSLAGVDVPLRVMSWEDTISYLIRHAAVQHLVESPTWLNDVAFALEAAEAEKGSVDWESIVHDLSERKNRIASIFFLRLLQSYSAFPVPQRVFAAFAVRQPLPRLRLFFSRVSYEKFFRRRSWLFVLRFRALLKDSLYQTFVYFIRREMRKWLQIRSKA